MAAPLSVVKPVSETDREDMVIEAVTDACIAVVKVTLLETSGILLIMVVVAMPEDLSGVS